MASAGVLKLQVSRRQKSHSQPGARKVASRQRRPLNCLECRTLKVSCDRTLPCSRCRWRGKADVCSYARFPPMISNKPQSDDKQKPNRGFGNQRATSNTLRTLPGSFLDDGVSLEHLHCVTQSLVGPNSLLPQLAFELRLANTLTGLYQQLSCVSEYLNNPWREPMLVQRGETHWQGILHQCAMTVPDLLHDIPTYSDFESRGSYQNSFNSARIPSFPFEIDLDDSPLPKSEIIARYVPSMDVTKTLVGAYFETIEGVNRLFHIPTFELELEYYSQDPSSSKYDWLAQLLTILALGSRIMQERVRQRLAAFNSPYSVESYLRGASKCLAHLSYPFHASLEAVRALCLISTAKTTSLFSCHERDACGPLLEAAFSMCLMLGLDRRTDDEACVGQTSVSTAMETRVWTTVRYMYLHHLMHTGIATNLPLSVMKPAILSKGNSREDGLMSAQKEGDHNAGDCTGSSVELLLSRFLPLAFTLVSLANHPPSICPKHVDLVTAERLVRTLLRQTDEIYSGIGSTRRRMHHCMFVIFLRRMLLTIYRLDSQWTTQGSALQTSATPSFSPLAMTECAISILIQQRSLLEDPVFSDYGGRVVAELFKEDFLFASLVIGSEWTRSADLSARHGGSTSMTVLGPTSSFSRKTVLHGLYWCRELWARDIDQSICNLAAYSMLGRLLDLLASDSIIFCS